MFHLFAISSSQCSHKGSAGKSNDPVLVAWLAHNLLITLPALPPTILFWFEQTLSFCWFTLYIFAFQHAWTWFLSFVCHFSIPVYYKGLSRAIHPHNFSRQADAQFVYSTTCLATSDFVSVWADNYLSVSSLVSHIYIFFSLNMS